MISILTIISLGISVAAFPALNARTADTFRISHPVFMSEDDMCEDGFYKKTGPDGEYCVFDYNTVTQKFGTDPENQVLDADNYFEGLERQNEARKKFGLKPLTPEQYVVHQANSQEIVASKLSEATAEAFTQFDTNQDGVITFREFKEGMEKVLRPKLSEASVRKVFEHYDASGDGLLQPDEFVTIDRLRNQLDLAIREVQQQQEQSMAELPGMFQGFLNNLAVVFQDTCESNYDCDRPEVCCDFGYKKMCCSSGQMTKNLQLEYAMVTISTNRDNN